MSSKVSNGILERIRSIESILSDRLTQLIGFVFRNKLSTSFGAITGFALAIICMWRLFRKPHNRRSHTKRQNNTPRSSDTAITATGVTRGITNPTQRGTIQQKSSTQTSVTQLMKRQLNGGNKMTCQLLGVVLKQTSCEELINGVEIRPSIAETLIEISNFCEIYFVVRVENDQNEEAIMNALSNSEIFQKGKLNMQKILFCSSDIGITSFVRQIEPDWHVDSCVENIEKLKRFVRNLLLVGGSFQFDSPNIVCANSFEHYFAGQF